MDPPSFLLHHRRLLLRPPPLPELYPGGAAASTTTSVGPSSFSSPASPSSPLLIPFFVIFISLLFFLLGFLFHDIFSFLQSPSPSSSNKRKNGVNPSVLNSFPVIIYTEVLRNRLGVADCAVCLSEFEGGENVRFITVCSHMFHAECIDFWLESHFTCPICRADLRNEDEERAVSGVCQGVSNG